jgi:hypothetical protein
MFNPGFTSPSLLNGLNGLRLQGFHLLRRVIPNASLVVRLIRVRSPLLAESLLLSFPVPTEMFHFSTFALDPYTFRVKYPEGWVAPFRNPKVNACLPAHLGLSQVTASFIASRYQDIRRTPFCSVIPTGRRLRRRSLRQIVSPPVVKGHAPGFRRSSFLLARVPRFVLRLRLAHSLTLGLHRSGTASPWRCKNSILTASITT